MNTAAATAERTKTMVMISLMAAVICILGPLSLAIPISPVPISLTNLAVYFTIYVLGTKKGTISYLIYLLIGLIGIPVSDLATEPVNICVISQNIRMLSSSLLLWTLTKRDLIR